MRSDKLAIVHSFNNACGGTENEALELYKLLHSRCHVELWALQQPDPHLQARYKIRRISLLKWQFPRGAHLLFPGASRPGNWIYFCRARVVSLLANTLTPGRLASRIRKWRRVPKTALNVFFVSRAQREQMPVEGPVVVSPVDMARFKPSEQTQTHADLRVGRLSRDVPYKHGVEDPAVYRQLAAAGWQIEVRGGTCLEAATGDIEGLLLTPESPDSPEEFLRSLDVFFYRTRTDWFESFGRVVLEAMASGCVVVAHRAGGYADLIAHGETGFLFETSTEALDILDTLKRDPELRARVKLAARSAAEEIASEQSAEQLLNYFTAPLPPA